MKRLTRHFESYWWLDDVIGIGLVFNKRGFNLVVGPINLSFKFMTNKDLAYRQRVREALASGADFNWEELIDEDELDQA